MGFYYLHNLDFSTKDKDYVVDKKGEFTFSRPLKQLVVYYGTINERFHT